MIGSMIIGSVVVTGLLFLLIYKKVEGLWRLSALNPSTYTYGYVMLIAYGWMGVGSWKVFTLWEQGAWGEGFMGLALIVLLASVWISDLKDQLILNVFTYPAIGFFFVGSIWIHGDYVVGVHIAGGLLVFGLLMLMEWMMKKKMGRGDVKLFIALGFFFGAFDIILLMVGASLIGLFIGGYLYVKRGKSEYFAFGPCIVVSAWVLWIGDIHLPM